MGGGLESEVKIPVQELELSQREEGAYFWENTVLLCNKVNCKLYNITQVPIITYMYYNIMCIQNLIIMTKHN